MAKLWSKWFGNGEIGIDLGTANTLVYVSGQGIVINEPTLVSINEKTGRVVAIGHDAKQMIGRTPGHLSVVKPLVDGVISNFEVAEEMLTYFMRKLGVEAGQRFFRPQVVIGVPSGITNVQIRAVRDAARNAGARAVHIIEGPMAAAIGMRLPIHDPIGHIVVDLGAGTTDIAVLSLGGIVRSKNLKIAGDRFNEDIASYIRVGRDAHAARRQQHGQFDRRAAFQIEDGAAARRRGELIRRRAGVGYGQRHRERAVFVRGGHHALGQHYVGGDHEARAQAEDERGRVPGRAARADNRTGDRAGVQRSRLHSFSSPATSNADSAPAP
jgi:hypothetical protein